MSDTIAKQTNSNVKTLEKRGRKKGSQDSVFVSIETLLKYVGSSTVIPVRRKWAQQLEEFHNVRFVSENKEAEVVPVGSNATEETLGSEKEAEIRERILLEEEEL